MMETDALSIKTKFRPANSSTNSPQDSAQPARVLACGKDQTLCCPQTSLRHGESSPSQIQYADLNRDEEPMPFIRDAAGEGKLIVVERGVLISSFFFSFRERR